MSSPFRETWPAPPEEIGQKVGAALVGTFLGILLSYGVVAPIASNIEKIVNANTQFHQVLRAGLIAYAKGERKGITIPSGKGPVAVPSAAAKAG